MKRWLWLLLILPLLLAGCSREMDAEYSAKMVTPLVPGHYTATTVRGDSHGAVLEIDGREYVVRSVISGELKSFIAAAPQEIRIQVDEGLIIGINGKVVPQEGWIIGVVMGSVFGGIFLIGLLVFGSGGVSMWLECRKHGVGKKNEKPKKGGRIVKLVMKYLAIFALLVSAPIGLTIASFEYDWPAWGQSLAVSYVAASLLVLVAVVLVSECFRRGVKSGVQGFVNWIRG